ncbi:MAG: MFS transporter [Alphaproteobacteria bacterium]|nr:MFS transporter [Alphaproteobacteria bacterium]
MTVVAAMPPDHIPKSPAGAVGGGFIALYTLAQIGAFIAFIPMLNLLLPLKAEAVDLSGKAILLSQVTVLGAIVAGFANLAAGILSDATRGRWGRRRPWIAGGAVAVAGAHGLVYLADGLWSLIAAVVAFQVALNLMFGPLNAVLADRVPDRQKGTVSALQGLALPAAGLFSAVVLAMALGGLAERFLITALAVPLLVLPFALLVPDRSEAGLPVARPRLSLRVLADRDFRLAFTSRLLVQVSITLNVLYLLFYLQDVATLPDLSATAAETAFGWLLTAGTLGGLIFGFVGGILSDRTRRRRLLVMSGGLLMAVGAGLMVAQPVWPGPLLAQIVFGIGLGLYSTVDIALVAEVLPDRSSAGRDLGVMNLAITMPQIAAPLIGLGVLLAFGGELRWVFAISAAFALVGAIAVMGIRRVR